MSVKYRVLWTQSAIHDLRAVMTYISVSSFVTARKQLTRVTKRAVSLERYPERGRVVPELREQGVLMYRELVIAPWRLIYRISGNDVFIVCFLDSRRNVEDILLDRLVRH
jgi:plasmid stabilization system protein ParE